MHKLANSHEHKQPPNEQNLISGTTGKHPEPPQNLPGTLSGNVMWADPQANVVGAQTPWVFGNYRSSPKMQKWFRTILLFHLFWGARMFFFSNWHVPTCNFPVAGGWMTPACGCMIWGVCARENNYIITNFLEHQSWLNKLTWWQMMSNCAKWCQMMVEMVEDNNKWW